MLRRDKLPVRDEADGWVGADGIHENKVSIVADTMDNEGNTNA